MAREHFNSVDGGWVECEDLLGELTFESAMDGVVWCIRLTVNVPESTFQGAPPNEFVCVSGVNGSLYFVVGGKRRLLGASLGNPPASRRPGPHHYDLRVPIPSATLAALELARDGATPNFELHFRAGVQRSGPHIRSTSDALPAFVSAALRFGVPRDAWVKALGEAEVKHNVILEVPLGGPAREGYQEVVKHLLEAKEDFDRGGTTGWRGCAIAIRNALDAWPNPRMGNTVQFERGMWS